MTARALSNAWPHRYTAVPLMMPLAVGAAPARRARAGRASLCIPEHRRGTGQAGARALRVATVSGIRRLADSDSEDRDRRGLRSSRRRDSAAGHQTPKGRPTDEGKVRWKGIPRSGILPVPH